MTSAVAPTQFHSQPAAQGKLSDQQSHTTGSKFQALDLCSVIKNKLFSHLQFLRLTRRPCTLIEDPSPSPISELMKILVLTWHLHVDSGWGSCLYCPCQTVPCLPCRVSNKVHRESDLESCFFKLIELPGFYGLASGLASGFSSSCCSIPVFWRGSEYATSKICHCSIRLFRVEGN